MMARRPDVLSARALNRALLARQLLLRRSTLGPAAAVGHLVGLQAQIPNAPYLALWSRLDGFQVDDLTRLITRRRVVRLAMMRSTIHMVTARDCLMLRRVIQPAIDRGLQGSVGRALAGLNRDAVAEAGRALVDEQPRSLGELGALLRIRWPGRDPMALGQLVRARVPLVQVPPRGVWGSHGAAVHTSAEHWLGRALAANGSVSRMLLRYLGAFGPASLRDAQTWSGLSQLDEHIERLRPRLRAFRDERGLELFDVPDAPRPHEDIEAPTRFLPEFDNLLLGHRDRSRIVAGVHRPRLLGSGGLLTGTVLVDGFVGGRWRLTRGGRRAVLTIEPFGVLTRKDRRSLVDEGQRLLRFAAADAAGHDVKL